MLLALPALVVLPSERLVSSIGGTGSTPLFLAVSCFKVKKTVDNANATGNLQLSVRCNGCAFQEGLSNLGGVLGVEPSALCENCTNTEWKSITTFSLQLIRGWTSRPNARIFL
jgi:hypothetical protein